MVRDVDEHERPSEWLRNLLESSLGYANLLARSGGLAEAAYRIASARCRARERATAVPTALEVHAAAREVLQLAGVAGGHLPSVAGIEQDCDQAGLLVIGTPRPRWAI